MGFTDLFAQIMIADFNNYSGPFLFAIAFEGNPVVSTIGSDSGAFLGTDVGLVSQWVSGPGQSVVTVNTFASLAWTLDPGTEGNMIIFFGGELGVDLGVDLSGEDGIQWEYAINPFDHTVVVLLRDSLGVVSSGTVAVPASQLGAALPFSSLSGTADLSDIDDIEFFFTDAVGASTLTITSISTSIPAPDVPDAINDLTLTVISGTQVDLSWTTPDDGGSPITGYVIVSKVNGVGSTIETSFGDASTTSYSDTTLTLGDVVTYKIAAINAEGQGPFSNIPASVTTVGGGTIPDQVTDLSLSVVSGTQVDLSWTTPDDGGSPITGYGINSKVNGVVSTLETSFGDASTTSYSDTSLSAGDVVTYRIAAINTEGQGPLSNIPAQVTTELSVIEQILNSISQLIADLSQEVTDRIAGDTDLQNQIDVLGSIGLSYYVSQNIILPPGDFGSLWLLTCNQNELIVSGGAEEIQFSTPGVTIAESYPNVSDGWIIRVDNPSVFDVTFRVWIVCISFLSGNAADVSSQAPSQEPGILEAIPIQKQIRDNIEN